MSETIEIEPKSPTNPAGKPGVGGLAGIPSVIGAIIGADDFCSVWNFPLSAICVDDPNSDTTGMPAWCQFAPTGYLCPGTEPFENPTTGLNWSSEYCFDSTWKKVNCETTAQMCNAYEKTTFRQDTQTYNYNSMNPSQLPCNDMAVCKDIKGIFVNCDLGKGQYWVMHQGTLIKSLGPGMAPKERKCLYMYNKDGFNVTTTSDCIVNIDTSIRTNTGYTFDKYMRLTDPKTGIPITNEEYEGGYPINAVYSSPPAEEVTPVPSIPTESCGTICDWLHIIHADLISIDTSLIAFLDYLEEFILNINPPTELGIVDKLNEILAAIDTISIEVVKEAGTNFWDVLGGAFGDIFDLIEFIIEKIIYLVIPEDSTAIVNAFDMLQAQLQGKVEPIHEIQTHITQSIPTEQKDFENISITLPKYGDITFFKVEYLMMAIPFIRQLISATLVLTTAIWAYRKVSSEMIR